MKTNLCILTLILFSIVFYILSVDAHDPGLVIDTAFVDQNGKYKIANEADKRLIEAQSLMAILGVKYDLKKEAIRNGSEVLLSNVFTSAVAVTVTYATGGSTAPVMVPTAVSSLVQSLGLVSSINNEVAVLSAYETAIDETISRIATAKTAVTNYASSWGAYDTLVRTHNNEGPHKGSTTGDHPIDKYINISPNYNLPSFACGGSCNQSFPKPTSPHWTDCSVCPVSYFNCNSADKLYHEGQPCTVTVTKKYLQADGSYTSKTEACPHNTRVCDPRVGIHLWNYNKDGNLTGYTKSWHGPLPPYFPPPHYGWTRFRVDTNNPRYYDDVLKAGITLSPTLLPSPEPIPAPAPTPSYHTCGVHETSVSGDHSAAGCGVSGHYVCDGSDHSLQASCTTTNASGQYCTVSSFYACQSHTHVYPAAPAISCGRSGCTQTVSSSTAHQVTCSAGHQYWSCGQYASWHANHHRTRTCRFGKCGQSWQRCSRPSSAPTPMCTDPTRTGERCWAKS